MEILHSIKDVRSWHAVVRGQTVVLVPTMGALHDGHLQLMEEARKLAGAEGKVVVSIFVNPTQFGPKEDFSRYPRELESDAEKCRSVGVDMIFAPEAGEVYAEDRSLSVLETQMSQRLCGASRPGHFDGVCLVVLKLFLITQPDIAVFGKKDYQQLAIIRRMVRDLNVPIELVGVETVREPDGLAMSSRNRYLNAEERAQAVHIRKGLLSAKQNWQNGLDDAEALKEHFRQHLQAHAPLHRLDYVECVDASSLESEVNASSSSVLAVAVFFGNTRLIDNLELA